MVCPIVLVGYLLYLASSASRLQDAGMLELDISHIVVTARPGVQLI